MPKTLRPSPGRAKFTERMMHRPITKTQPICRLLTILVALGTTVGCQSLSTAKPPFFGSSPDPASQPPALPAEEEKPTLEQLSETTKKSTTSVMNFVTGREQENVPRAKELYQQADAIYREAKTLSREQAIPQFSSAAKLFRKANEAAPGTALQQDAMFMQAESLFFADKLTQASEAYTKLQKDYPRNRHNDRITARIFSISQYWIDIEKATEGQMSLPNFVDSKRPRMDPDGHAIRLLDQLRYDDPTGKLADDATMAAAAEFIRQKKFDKADEFLTDLRETYTDSDHLFLAHLLGIEAKLQVYAGPIYSGLVLDEAKELVQKTRQRFPDKLRDPQYDDVLAKSAAKISMLQAERLAYRAQFREKKKEYRAAAYYYKQLLTDHQNTPHAEKARERLAQIEALPDVPTRRLSWLKTFFPDQKQSSPLQTTFEDGSTPQQPQGETMLR